MSAAGTAGVAAIRPAFSGMDEAGYGPFLGPLVVARVRRRGGGEGWATLSGAVASRPRRGDGRVLVCDSKKAYAPGRLAALERTVLAFLAAEHGAAPAKFGELEAALVPDRRAPGEAPTKWFNPALALPLAADPRGIEESAEALRAAFREAGVDSLSLEARAVDAREFNEGARRLGSKAALLAELAARFIADAGDGERFVIDRWGGRKDYGAALRSAFGGPGSCRLEATTGNGDCASYRVEFAAGAAEIAFRTRAESSCFEVALASMTAKYLREVHMAAFNAWWCARVPGLRPTAGYPVDAKRWLADAAPRIAALGLELDEVWRCR